MICLSGTLENTGGELAFFQSSAVSEFFKGLLKIDLYGQAFQAFPLWNSPLRTDCTANICEG